MEKPDNIRTTASRWLSILSIALLGYCGFILAVAWMQAWRDGAIPEQWGQSQGNHGPWQGYSGETLVWRAIAAPLLAFCVAVVAFIVRPSIRVAVLAGACLLMSFVVTLTHFWLVD